MLVMTCRGGIVQESAGMLIRLLSILYNIIALKLIQWFLMGLEPPESSYSLVPFFEDF